MASEICLRNWMDAMSKNNKFINQQIQLKRYLDTVIPQIYSAFCIVLNRHDVEDEDIEQIFAETQELWTEASENGTDIIRYAYELTGILTVSVKQAKQMGLEIPEQTQELIERMYGK